MFLDCNTDISRGAATPPVNYAAVKAGTYICGVFASGCRPRSGPAPAAGAPPENSPGFITAASKEDGNVRTRGREAAKIDPYCLGLRPKMAAKDSSEDREWVSCKRVINYFMLD